MADGQTKVVEVPGVGNVEFPASMADKDIGAAIQKHLLSDESYQAAHPPSAPAPMAMKQNYDALALSNSPSGADPHNPGNPNLNAVPESERENANNTALTYQVASLGTAPIAEAAITGSVKPLIPLAKTAIGAYGGHYLGHQVGSAFAPVLGPKAPAYGGEIGGLAGGLYGMTGKSLPTKEDVLNLFKSDAELADEASLAKGKDMIDAMRQQPEAFGMSKKGGLHVENPAETENEAYLAKGKDMTDAMRQQPNAFGMVRGRGGLRVASAPDPYAPPETAEAARQADIANPSGVAVVPEPRDALPSDRPGSAWSLTRTKGLPEAAQRGQPGALDVMRQLKPTLVIPRGGDIETPSMSALRDSLGITESVPQGNADPFAPAPPVVPQGNPSPFEPSVTQGWLKPKKQLVLQ